MGMHTRIALIALLVGGTACAPPAPPPAPPAGESQAPKPRPPLSTSFLGIELGKPLEAEDCGSRTYSRDRTVLCRDRMGDIYPPIDSIPTGLAPDLTIVRREGKVAKIYATVEEGHDGRIVGNLVDKYGPAHYVPGDGELQWIDAYMAVLYLPATPYKDGMIVVTTQAENQASKSRDAEAQRRPL